MSLKDTQKDASLAKRELDEKKHQREQEIMSSRKISKQTSLIGEGGASRVVQW